jgi:hypothetical protein
MQMAVTCRTCLRTSSITATWILYLHARPIPRSQDIIKINLVNVKCDPHSANVDMDSWADVYDMERKKIAVHKIRGIYLLVSSSEFHYVSVACN